MSRPGKKPRKKPRARRYTVRDLRLMAEQMGCVVRFELIPLPPKTAHTEATCCCSEHTNGGRCLQCPQHGVQPETGEQK